MALLGIKKKQLPICVGLIKISIYSKGSLQNIKIHFLPIVGFDALKSMRTGAKLYSIRRHVEELPPFSAQAHTGSGVCHVPVSESGQ